MTALVEFLNRIWYSICNFFSICFYGPARYTINEFHGGRGGSNSPSWFSRLRSNYGYSKVSPDSVDDLDLLEANVAYGSDDEQYESILALQEQRQQQQRGRFSGSFKNSGFILSGKYYDNFLSRELQGNRDAQLMSREEIDQLTDLIVDERRRQSTIKSFHSANSESSNNTLSSASAKIVTEIDGHLGDSGDVGELLAVSRYSTWCQLASINCLTGQPTIRTVVFRGLVLRKDGHDKQPVQLTPEIIPTGDALSVKDTPYLIICSDIRSTKFKGMTSSPFDSELCWLFHNETMQFRIKAKAHVVAHSMYNQINSYPSLEDNSIDTKGFWERCRQNVVKSLNEFLLKSFCGGVPGEPLTVDVNTLDAVDPVKVDQNCCLIVLEPLHVETLHLHSAERVSYSHSDQSDIWNATSLNP